MERWQDFKYSTVYLGMISGRNLQLYLHPLSQVVIKSGKLVSVSLSIAHICEQETKGKKYLGILIFLFYREQLLKDCKKGKFMFRLDEKPSRSGEITTQGCNILNPSRSE